MILVLSIELEDFDDTNDLLVLSSEAPNGGTRRASVLVPRYDKHRDVVAIARRIPPLLRSFAGQDGHVSRPYFDALTEILLKK